MRNMSFFLTTVQMREGTKTVTRRLGWSDLEPGEHFMAVVKGQGIPKGGKVERIYECVCVNNRPEKLLLMIANPRYGKREAILEGFPQMSGREFVKMFCEHNECEPDEVINRIEFKPVCGEQGTFKFSATPRQRRRVMMHHTDAGPGNPNWARFECKCGHKCECGNVLDSELRTGRPCPKCNSTK